MTTAKSQKKPQPSTLVARVPKALLSALDAEAKRNERTRSAEARIRLQQSFCTSAAAK